MNEYLHPSVDDQSTINHTTMETTRFQDQHVVITGGSSGIGLAVARLAAGRGASVTLLARRLERLERACAAVGDRARAHVVDVTDETALARVMSSLGPIDHLVTAAGGQAVDAPFLDLDPGVARRLFEVKYWGQYHALRCALPHMRKHGSATLFSAWLARKPTAGFPTYAAIDGAVEALARVLAQELAPLRINVVSPGVIDTALYDNLDTATREQVFAGVASQLPLGRVGTPEECATAVLYLMDNAYSTGAVVDVDGGWR